MRSTEQERQEFEASFIAEKFRWMGEPYSEGGEKSIRAFHLVMRNGEYTSLEARFAWWAWNAGQTARRVAALPQDVKTTAFQCAPCPCCGSVEIERTGCHLGDGDPFDWGVYEGCIQCKDCLVSVVHTSRVSIDAAESSAVGAWNCRVQSASSELEDQLEQAICELQTGPYPSIALAVKRLESCLENVKHARSGITC